MTHGVQLVLKAVYTVGSQASRQQFLTNWLRCKILKIAVICVHCVPCVVSCCSVRCGVSSGCDVSD